MPMRDEFIERAVRQLAAALAKLTAAGSRAALTPSHLEEITAQVTGLYPAFLGTSAALVDMLSVDDLLGVIGSAGYVDGERAYLLSALLETEAEATAASASLGGEPAAPPAGVAGRVAHLKERALVLMLEAGATGLGEEDVRERVARLAAALPPERLDGDYWERLHRCEVGLGAFARAEDALFAWLDQVPHDSQRVARSGLVFYAGLQGLEDAALEKGGLPREEIGEGRADLEARLARAQPERS